MSDFPALDPLQLRDRSLILHVAGVERALRLQQHDVRLFISGRKMLDAARNDDELARPNHDLALDAILASFMRSSPLATKNSSSSLSW